MAQTNLSTVSNATHLSVATAPNNAIVIVSSTGQDAVIPAAAVRTAADRFAPCTWANRPTAPYTGLSGWFTDCPTNPVGNFAATVSAGSGTYVVPVYYNGSAWILG